MEMNLLYLAESILTLISGIQTTVTCFYHILLTLGHIIFSSIIETFRIFNRIIGGSVYIISILKEDFEIFKHDLQVLCYPIQNWVTEIIEGSFKSLYQGYVFIQSLFDGAVGSLNLFSNQYQWVKTCGKNSWILMIDSLSLIGKLVIFCLDWLRYVFSIETYSGFIRELNNIAVYKISYILKQEALFGLLIVICLSAVTLKSKVHLKIFKIIKLLLLILATSSLAGFRFLLKVIPISLTSVVRKFQNTRCYLRKNVKKIKTCPKLSRDELQLLLEQEKAEKLCVICMDRKRNIILLSCQHLILCNICVVTVLEDNGLCPVCRRDIYEVIRVYT